MLDGGGGKDANPDGGAFSAMSKGKRIVAEVGFRFGRGAELRTARRLYSTSSEWQLYRWCAEAIPPQMVRTKFRDERVQHAGKKTSSVVHTRKLVDIRGTRCGEALYLKPKDSWNQERSKLRRS